MIYHFVPTLRSGTSAASAENGASSSSAKAESGEDADGEAAGEKAASEDRSGFFTPNNSIDFSNVKIEPLFEEQVDFNTFSKSDFRAVKVKECSAVPKSKKLLKFVLDDGTGTDRVILSGIHAYYEPEELVGKKVMVLANLKPRMIAGYESQGMLLSAAFEKDGEEILSLMTSLRDMPAGADIA